VVRVVRTTGADSAGTTVRVMTVVMSVRAALGLRVTIAVGRVVTIVVMSVRAVSVLRVMTGGGMTVRVVRVVRTTGADSAAMTVPVTIGRVETGGRRCRGGGGLRTVDGMTVGRSGSRSSGCRFRTR
jgi:hypothetical protein